MFQETISNGLFVYADCYRSIQNYMESIQLLWDMKKSGTKNQRALRYLFHLQLLIDQKVNILQTMIHEMNLRLNGALRSEIRLNQLRLAKLFGQLNVNEPDQSKNVKLTVSRNFRKPNAIPLLYITQFRNKRGHYDLEE